MSTFVRVGKKVKKFVKSVLLPEPKCSVSYCRRIERVKTDKKVCAMTFDDGPMNLPANPDEFGGKPLTDVILDILGEFNAKGTFDVIGDTGANYPDTCGETGTPSWGGVAYDHYPAFKQDAFGGAVHCERLVERIIAEGHQITNHGYQHILFGKKPYVYGNRHILGSLDKVIEDLTTLDKVMRGNYGYPISMGRPPHYVDKIDKLFTSYDAYSFMGYQYLAASFDGAGWLPSKHENPYEKEVEEMVLPMQKKLEENPDFFCGQIIFQKDGYNMAMRTPVAHGLRKQLELLDAAGYRVVTVQDLLKISPFADVGEDDPDFDAFCRLIESHAIAYSNNTLQPDRPMTCGEFAMLAAPRYAAVNWRLDQLKAGNKAFRNSYSGAMQWCCQEKILPQKTKDTEILNAELLAGAADLFVNGIPESFTRREILRNFKG